jgi:hypothetical protein
MLEIDDTAFRPLLEYLQSSKQPQNQVLGLAYRRGFAPDISKRSWTDPKLFHLVSKFWALVSDPSLTPAPSAIQIFRGEGKLDGHNKTSSWVVRFGSFTGGELVLKTPTDTEHNIRHRPIIFNPKETEHYFKEAVGDCWTIVFYTVTSKIPPERSLSDYEAVCVDGKWSIAFYRTGQPTLYLSKKSGLPFISKKKEAEKWSFMGAQKKVAEEQKDDPRFSAAQNLMMRASTLNTE